MAEYRVFTVGDERHFASFPAFKCADDADPITWAKQLVDGFPVELWSGGRFVARPGPKSP
jgi:hypothetical protein